MGTYKTEGNKVDMRLFACVLLRSQQKGEPG